MLILQAILSVLALVQLWRTQMLPAWYLFLFAALLVLCWFIVRRLFVLHNKGGRIAAGVFSAVFCAAMALGCVWAQQGLTALDSVTSGILRGAKANAITKKSFVIYLSGVDTRGELTENARSDVNILAVVNPVTKRVALINTPRDYYVDLAGTNSKDKLTHAGLYGVETSMQTLGNLYGIEVEHYIRINFAGFMSIVDALGGVDVYSDYAFTSVGSPGYYDPTTFVEGWNHLDGKAALAFARERHAFATGDIQRGIHQMKVIDAMLNKIKSPALLLNFSKLMDAAADCFVTSFSSDQISALVRMQLGDFASWEIQSCTVTGSSSTSTKCYSAQGQKLYVMKPDEASVNEAIALIQSVLGGEASGTGSSNPSYGGQNAHSATADPNAGAPASSAVEETVPEEQPVEELPAESDAAELPADNEAVGPEQPPAEEDTQAPGAASEAEDGSDPSGNVGTLPDPSQILGGLFDTLTGMMEDLSDAASQASASAGQAA
ncbi:MAG: LCP family protein [Faecalibacterium sp.]